MSTAVSIDALLSKLELPMNPEELCQKLDLIVDGYDPYDFIADRGGRKARDCWIASKFLIAHGEKAGKRYGITNIMTEAPDMEYQVLGEPRNTLSVEVTELLSPGYRRSEEYLKDKLEREACRKKGREYKPGLKDLPHEFLEQEKSQFSSVASEELDKKLRKDYGSNCTLVLYVNMWLFSDKPVREFVASHRFLETIRLKEIWFLYGGSIIPLKV